MGEERFDLMLAHVSRVPHVVIADESLYPGQIRPLGFERIVFSAQDIDDDRKKLLISGAPVHHSDLLIGSKYQIFKHGKLTRYNFNEEMI
jgi:hypothetical protein